MTWLTPLRVGVIGTGRIGVLHARNLAGKIPGVRLEAVSDVVAAAAEKCAAELGVASATTDHRRILDRKDIDAVVICSSTDTHSRMIGEAAEAGKHIFCEKPIDFDLARIDEALAKVKRAGVKLQIGFNRRFDPNFQRVRDLVVAGSVGTPHLLRITSRDPSPPPIAYVKVSGGIFLDMTIHDFDMARYLDGLRGDGDVRGGRRARRPRDRQGRRHRHRRGHPAVRERRDRHDRQQPQVGVRLRPARGGLRLGRHGRGRQRLPQHRDREQRPVRRAATCR